MLTQLSIKNLITITELTLEFHSGLTVFTGETGAGKSILLDALGLVLGMRANMHLIAKNADRTEITALFDIHTNSEARQNLHSLELETDDAECMVRRTISRDGRSRAYINGSPVPLQTLRTLGQSLVEIHGQNTHLSLLKNDVQRTVLDNFAQHEPFLNQLAHAYQQLHTLEQQLNELEHLRQEHENQLDFLHFQLSELQTANLEDSTEFERLNQEHRRLSHATTLISTANSICTQLSDSDTAITHTLQDALNRLESLLDVEPQLQESIELLQVAQTNIEEAQRSLRRSLDPEAFDENALDAIDQRLSVLHELARKHRTTPEKLTERYAELNDQYHRIEHLQEQRESLRNKRETLEKGLSENGERATQGTNPSRSFTLSAR